MLPGSCPWARQLLGWRQTQPPRRSQQPPPLVCRSRLRGPRQSRRSRRQTSHRRRFARPPATISRTCSMLRWRLRRRQTREKRVWRTKLSQGRKRVKRKTEVASGKTRVGSGKTAVRAKSVGVAQARRSAASAGNVAARADGEAEAGGAAAAGGGAEARGDAAQAGAAAAAGAEAAAVARARPTTGPSHPSPCPQGMATHPTRSPPHHLEIAMRGEKAAVRGTAVLVGLIPARGRGQSGIKRASLERFLTGCRTSCPELTQSHHQAWMHPGSR
mmetsp:Transcript_32611/g.93518  ORF Transcript_32611/g.93518 Transcript_32611/m.93518 type:complete len:273 (+) Transcript_32611:447-1265(+)